MVSISTADTSADVEEIRCLFREYEAYLGISLCFQNFETELATLPGDYAPPDGTLLLARYQEQVAGCVALRKFDDGICEMKRLYVRPRYQGMKVGRALAERVINHARRIGYARMRLDTLPKLEAALSLYKSLGFREIAPFRNYCGIEAIFIEMTVMQ
jgi:ribosomal protein S18 acetylase RimI-like enzyme